MDLRELGERASIKRLREVLGATEDLGRGEDDCAVVPLGDGKVLLASTDVLIGPTHLLPGTPPEQFGAFAIEIAVSDVAALGGRPLGVLTAMARPPGRRPLADTGRRYWEATPRPPRPRRWRSLPWA